MRNLLLIIVLLGSLSITATAQMGKKSIALKPISLTDTLLKWKMQNLRILNPSARFLNKDYTHHQLGVNFSRGLRTLLLLNDTKPSPSSSDSYVLFYKYITNRSVAFRIGFGYDRLSNQEVISAGIRKEENDNLDVRLGVEYRKLISNRFQGMVGIDGSYFKHAARVVAETAFDSVTSETSYEGFGLTQFVGLQFNLNRQLALSTEAGYNFLTGNEHLRTLFAKGTDKDSDKKTKKDSQKYNGPLAIFLIFKF